MRNGRTNVVPGLDHSAKKSHKTKDSGLRDTRGSKIEAERIGDVVVIDAYPALEPESGETVNSTEITLFELWEGLGDTRKQIIQTSLQISRETNSTYVLGTWPVRLTETTGV